MDKLKLPENFLLGAAMSAHQVEGNNSNSDWWGWEQKGRVPKSGKACDHYNRYSEDFSIAKDIGLNAVRISIEWARIEPREGQFDLEQIEHYRKVLLDLKSKGLTAFVTLHHFTLPNWLAEKRGFLNSRAPELFARYAGYVTAHLGGHISLLGTINEPEVYALMPYIKGLWPPFEKNIFHAFQIIHKLTRAHNLAYRAVKKVAPNLPVGIVKNNVYYEPFRKTNLLDKITCRIARYVGNFYILNRVRNHSDFIGLNYYFSHVFKFSITRGVKDMTTEDPKSDMGWRTYPKGLYYLLLELKRYNKPVYITENGIANAHDDMRKRYIKEHVEWALQAKNEGADLRGYFYWSLLDNYEWADGFGPRFGLVEIDYDNDQKRNVRKSAEIFKEIKSSHA